MLFYIVFLLFSYHGGSHASADSLNCTEGEDILQNHGDVILPNKPGQNCQWTLKSMGTKGIKETFFHFDTLLLGPGDYLTISAIDETKNTSLLLQNITESLFNNIFVTGTTKNLTINLVTSNETSKRQFDFFIERASSSVHLSVPEETVVKLLPLNVKTDNPISSWDLKISSKSGKKQNKIVASVDTKSPKIDLSFGSVKFLLDSTSDQFGNPDIGLNLIINDVFDPTNKLEIAIYAVTDACSKTVKLNEKIPNFTVAVDSKDLANLIDIKCLWIIESDDPSHLLNINYDDPDLQMQGGNHFVIRRGNRKSSSVHADITSDNYNMVKSNIYNLILDSSSLFITFEAFKTAGEHPHFDVIRSNDANFIKGSGHLELSPKTNFKKFFLKSTGSTAILSVLPKQSLSSDLYIYDQPIMSSENLIAFFKTGDLLPERILSNTGLLVLDFADYQNNLVINLESPTFNAGSTASLASGSLTLLSNQLACSNTYSWLIPPKHIAPNQDPQIVKSLVIVSLALEKGSSLTLTSQTSEPHTLTITGDDVMSLPTLYLAANISHILNYTRSVSCSNDTKTLLQVSVDIISLDPIVTIDVTGKQIFKSYNYPNAYPLLEWNIDTRQILLNSTTPKIFLIFNDIDLADNHVLEFPGSLHALDRQVIPGDSIIASPVPINFKRPFDPDVKTSRNIGDKLSGRGFNITVEPLVCGMQVSANATGQLQLNETDKPGKCVWIISLPVDPKVIKVFNFSLTGNLTDLTIHDANSIKDNRIIKLNGTQYVNSTSETIIIEYTSTNVAASLTWSSFDCHDPCNSFHRCINPSQRCDGNNDCGDWSDEANCEGKAPAPPQPAPETKGSSGVPGLVVVFVIIPLSIIIGILGTIFAPRIIARIRGGHYQEFREYSDVS